MEDGTKRKRPSKWILAGLFLVMMFFNWGLSKIMANEPFSAFVTIAFLTNGLAGVFFVSIYNTIIRKDNKKDDG